MSTLDDKINEIYSALLPPVNYRSTMKLFNEEDQMKEDIYNYTKDNCHIEKIQYELTFSHTEKKQDNLLWYIFSLKHLLPKSQENEFIFLIECVSGCKIQKTKASTTRVEVLFSLENAQKDDKIKVYLGNVNQKFKYRYSNYVEIPRSS